MINKSAIKFEDRDGHTGTKQNCSIIRGELYANEKCIAPQCTYTQTLYFIIGVR